MAQATVVPERPTVLSRRFVFGVRSEVKDGIHYLDDLTCCWVAGKNIVVYNTQYAQQKFIACTDACDYISAMAISPNRRTLAVAEAGDSPLICIYSCDLQSAQKFKRKRILQLPDVGSKEYVSLGFSGDGKFLVSQGGFPEWNLVYWYADKTRAPAVIPVMEKAAPGQDRRLISQCTICPKDAQLACVSGNGVFKFFRFSEGQLRPASGGIKGEPMNYLAHVWLPDDRIIVSTDNGDLLLLENCEYKYPLPLSPSDGLSIDVLIAHSKGFICGGDMGLVTIFERSEDKELFRKMRTLKVEPDRRDSETVSSGEEALKVLAFSLTPPPSEEYLALMTSNKQLFVLNLSNADFSKADDHICDSVAQRFHAGPITGLDICIRKPFIATCGKDRNVFLWNYATNTVEVAKHFATEVLSIAIHPTGLHLLVGFPDKLRFMNVYGDDIREFKSFGVRSCTECRFSSGGQFFAAMHSTVINVYFTYTCELLGYLRGHNGKIKSIYFVPPDDTRLMSAGVDGAIYEWNLTDFHKSNDHVIKAISYNAVTADSQTVYVAGNDRKLRLLERTHLAPLPDIDLRTTTIQCMVLSSGMKRLFCGCEDGAIRVMRTDGMEKALIVRGGQADRGPEHGEQNVLLETNAAHCGIVTRLAMTFDESFVVSAGEDGVLQIWDIMELTRSAKKEAQFAEEILIDKKELEERNRDIAELQAKVTELKQRAEAQQYKRELKHEEKIHELKEKFQEQKHKRSGNLETLLSDKNEQAIKFAEHRAEMDEKHRQDLSKVEQDYTAKIQALEEQALKLKGAIDDQRAEFERNKQQQEDNARNRREEDATEHETRLQQAREDIKNLSKMKSHMFRDSEEVNTEIEDATDMEILELKEHFEQRWKFEQEQSVKLKGDHAINSSKLQMLISDRDSKVNEIQDKLKQQASLYTQIKGFNNDIKALEHELHERSETIGDKDKRIYDLKKKNQELEKFKFVLEYKIKELHSQIDPRDEEIRRAHAKYAEMEAEADRYLHNNESLVLNIRGLKLKLDGQKKEIENLKSKLQDVDEYQSRLWTELSDLYGEKDSKKQKEITKALYYKHSATSAVAAQQSTKLLPSRTTEDALRDYSRERDYLERTVGGLKSKLIKDEETNRADRSRIIGENVTLIKQINELRREVRALQQSKKESQKAKESDAAREIEIQKSEIVRLRAKIGELERQVHAAGKPISQATPPPLA